MDRPQPVSPELVSDLRQSAHAQSLFWQLSADPPFPATLDSAGRQTAHSRSGHRLGRYSPAGGRICARKVGAKVEIDAVDFQASTIEIARQLSSGFPEIRYHCADIHHFGERAFLRHRALFARPASLQRRKKRWRCCAVAANFPGAMYWWPICAGAGLRSSASICSPPSVFREAMTRNDARVSVERAFSFRELSELARAAGWRDYGHRRFRFARQAIWLERPRRPMKIISTIADLRADRATKTDVASWFRRWELCMRGMFHSIRLARQNAGTEGEVAVSIFVNPLQFEPGSDFSRYPRPESADEEVCRAEGVDLIFRPLPNEMYADDRSTFVEETALSERLCGASRPGHFRGVCTVVTKLFHLLAPKRRFLARRIFSNWRSFAGWSATSISRSRSSPDRPSAKPMVSPSARATNISAREERAQAPIIRRRTAGGGELGARNPRAKFSRRCDRKSSRLPSPELITRRSWARTTCNRA